jgi:hypothetical protein
VLESTPDRGFIGRSNAMATYCRALNRLGRHAQAKAALQPMIERLSEADRRVVSFYANLYREYAEADAGLGNFVEATRLLGTRSQVSPSAGTISPNDPSSGSEHSQCGVWD